MITVHCSVTHLKQQNLIPIVMDINAVLIMSMANEVMKLIFAVLDVSFNSGHYTVTIKRQFLYINICSFPSYLSTRSY